MLWLLNEGGLSKQRQYVLPYLLKYMHAFIIKSLYWFAVVTRKTELLYMQKSYNFMNTILVQVESLSYFFNFLTHF